SEARPAHPHLRQAGRQPHHHRRRRPGAVGRSARRADPGLLRHSHRQPLRRAGDERGHPLALRREEPDGRLPRRRRRGACARFVEAAGQRPARDRRQAPRARRRIGSDEHHRRRRGAVLHPDRRYRRFGRHV
ncbi:hypothetical protein LTR94_033810, partial [Friedmanniomyces endolithicus]